MRDTREVMSEEPVGPTMVELTHQAYAALNSRDLDAITRFLEPSSVCDVSCWELGIYTGPEAICRFADEWIGDLYEYGVQVNEMQDLGNGVMFVAQVAHRAHTRHGYVELPSAAVLIWRDGKLRRVSVYPDGEQARAAASRVTDTSG